MVTNWVIHSEYTIKQGNYVRLIEYLIQVFLNDSMPLLKYYKTSSEKLHWHDYLNCDFSFIS